MVNDCRDCESGTLLRLSEQLIDTTMRTGPNLEEQVVPGVYAYMVS